MMSRKPFDGGIMEKKTQKPGQFFLLLGLFCFVIAAGILYAVLFLNGTLSPKKRIPAESGLFQVLVQVLPENGEDDPLSALLAYDPAYQKLTITAYNREPEAPEAHYLRISEENFCRIVDKAGGISLAGKDGSTVVLDGAAAYAYALGGGTGNRARDEAVLLSAFLDTLRLHAKDEAFSMKLLAFAFPRTETDIRLKEASAVGKNMLKADSIETEIFYG